jgi:type I restriction enzyme S subunit
MAAETGTTRTGGRAATEGHIRGDYALSVGAPDSAPRSGWAWKKLTEIARLETGHTPSRRHPEWWNGDIPWIGIRDATANHGRTIFETNQHTNQAGIENSSARVLPAHTVCLSRTASVGYVVVMGCPMATSQDFVNWVCDSEHLDYRFLKYVLLAERNAFLRFAHGTTHQTIYFPEVKAFHVCAPDVGAQSDIAEVLASLDDKIELNRQMARTLEAIVRAIFKAWFVDFEPVKAKAAGATSFRGMPQAIFDQLPDRFTDTELGPVPEGWEVETVGSQCNFNYGKALKAANRRTGFVPVYGSNGPVGHHDESLVSGPGIVVGRKGNPGTVTWVHSDFYPIDTTFYLTRISDESVSLPYLRYALDELRLGSYGSDSAVPGLNRNMAYGLQLIVPDTKTEGEFRALFLLYQERIYSNERESRALAALRDALLPKLISGELRVTAAEG